MAQICVAIQERPMCKVEMAKANPWKLGLNSIAHYDMDGAPEPMQSYVFGECFCPFWWCVVEIGILIG
jgi:hypothetical protein